MRLCYIHAYRRRFGVEPICAVLSEHGMKIPPQTYYRWRACPVRAAELDEAYLVNDIVDLYRRNKCVYGVGEDVPAPPAERVCGWVAIRSGG